jgi:hypothetical protein
MKLRRLREAAEKHDQAKIHVMRFEGLVMATALWIGACGSSGSANIYWATSRCDINAVEDLQW